MSIAQKSGGPVSISRNHVTQAQKRTEKVPVDKADYDDILSSRILSLKVIRRDPKLDAIFDLCIWFA